MSIGTLADIITKIRFLTSSGNNFQIPDEPINGIPGITDFINSFYNLDLPAEFRSLKLQDKYTFDTQRGIDTYAFDSENYTTVSMPCYCAKREIALFQDPWSFYGANFNWQNQENFATGTGSIGTTYTGLTQGKPILRSVNNNPANLNYPASRNQNLLITAIANAGDTTLNVTDNGSGTLIGDVDPLGVNTINYKTGAISVKFSQAVDAGTPIQIQYNPVQLSIPLCIMFFQNQFTLRPVPDRGYTIELVAYRKPTQALANTPGQIGVPELPEWWELLAFGAAKKIYQNRLDSDGVALMDQYLEDAYNVARSRTYAQLGTRRISTIFADQLSNNYGQGAGFMGSV